MDNENRSCIDCGSAACRGKGGQFPPFCRTEHLDEALLERSLEILKGEENAFSVAAAVNERDGYGTKSRIEETMHFAQLLGVKKIGIATCAGLIHEANALARVLRAQGYEVTGIACKCGTVNKTELGIPERCLEVGQNICNPVLQALVLNGEKTELNIALGLCVGHDSMFYKYSEAPVTTLSRQGPPALPRKPWAAVSARRLLETPPETRPLPHRAAEQNRRRKNRDTSN